ncbi:auxin response factor 17-like [Amaranthus tricolor]|uniref:auxin response factor 17-like n=1 Tax=Amaranthus tricolor TaxID=29722 RepID=UPI002583A1A4|nr:auxin response factor 17-like [Amaranthus tricolor]
MASDHRQRQCYYQQQQQEREVDAVIWKACAGSLIHVPKPNSRVYYFPQGHMEQASSPVPLSSVYKSSVLCRVVRVSFLADPDTDEVFVKFLLEPLKSTSSGFALEFLGERGEEKRNDVVSFAKVLTPSDANNGGGFSIPRFCAESIFPPLDFSADPPVQKIRVTDIHGESWEFRHIYRGTPKRNLFTTGWSKFVNCKKLIAGDSVVFMRKNLTKELFVGIRRASRLINDAMLPWGIVLKPARLSIGGGLSRSNKGKVSAEAVVEAIERAESDMVFEVAYYPRPGLPEFVVEAERVEVARGVYWRGGMKVKIAQETEDGSRLSWYNGTVSAVATGFDHGPWRDSWWRMLQVAWDEPEILQNMKNVSPWQVEPIVPMLPIHTAVPAIKKFKGVQNSGLLTNGEGNPPIPSMGFNSSYLNYNTFPAGMQGARQNLLFLSTLPSIVNYSTHQGHRDDIVDSTPEKMEAVTTKLNIGISPSETPSPDSQNSVQLFGVAGTDQRSCDLSKKIITSFQLFGKQIHMEQPLTTTEAIGCTKYDDHLTEGVRNTLDISSSVSHKKLDDRLRAHALSPL